MTAGGTPKLLHGQRSGGAAGSAAASTRLRRRGLKGPGSRLRSPFFGDVTPFHTVLGAASSTRQVAPLAALACSHAPPPRPHPAHRSRTRAPPRVPSLTLFTLGRSRIGSAAIGARTRAQRRELPTRPRQSRHPRHPGRCCTLDVPPFCTLDVPPCCGGSPAPRRATSCSPRRAAMCACGRSACPPA